MSSHYHCGQFNDSFKPSRLKNWCGKTHPWDKCCHSKKVKQFRDCGHLEFIADDRGHLLPNIKKERNLKPNWGFPILRIWDEGYGCGCYKPHIPKISHPTWEEIPKHFCDEERLIVDCGDEVKPKVEDTFDLIKKSRPPVIWIFGQVPKPIASLRKTFGKQLAKHLKFYYIDLDEKLIEWSHYLPNNNNNNMNNNNKKNDTNINPKKIYDISKTTLNVQRAIKFSKRLIEDNESTLNLPGILELIKICMIEGWPTKGYVIESFPCNDNEAKTYEDTFWESAAGIYFTSTEWTDNKTIEPEIIEPTYLRRDNIYSENDVEDVCDDYGYKTVKIIHAEDVHKDEVEYIDSILECFVSHYPEILSGRYSRHDVLTEHCKAMLLAKKEELNEEFESESESDSSDEPELKTITETEPEIEEEEESDEEVPEPEPEPVKVESDEIMNPPQLERNRPREFSDVGRRPMDYKLPEAGGAFYFPKVAEHTHDIPDMSKYPKKKEIIMKRRFKKDRKPDDSGKPPLSSDSDPDSTESGSEPEEQPVTPFINIDPNEPEFTPYTAEPVVDKETIHTIFPTKHKRPPPSESVWQRLQREKLLGPKQTLKEKIDIIFKPDDTWMDEEDEEIRKKNVPFVCCFDKRKQAQEYDRTKKALSGYPEPKKESFGKKCKKLLGRFLESLKPKHEEVLPATVALEKFNKEHPEEALKLNEDASNPKTPYLGAFADDPSLYRPSDNSNKIPSTTNINNIKKKSTTTLSGVHPTQNNINKNNRKSILRLDPPAAVNTQPSNTSAYTIIDDGDEKGKIN